MAVLQGRKRSGQKRAMLVLSIRRDRQRCGGYGSRSTDGGVAMRVPATMRGTVIMFAIFAVLYALATATRRLFLSGVVPISDEQAPQSMWLFDAAFLVRTVENVAAFGLAAVLLVAMVLWTTGFRRPGA
jgi:hypothetical protein